MDAKTIAMVRNSGRTWWVGLYRDGREVTEWSTIPGVPRLLARPRPELWGKSSWPELPKKGLVGVALIAPNGEVAVLQTAHEYTLFAFRWMQARVGGGKFCDAHLIGRVDDKDGTATCFVFEGAPHPFVPDLSWEKPTHCVTCKAPREVCGGRDYGEVRMFHEKLGENFIGQGVFRYFVGKPDGFKDNATNLAYRSTGMLALQTMGVRL